MPRNSGGVYSLPAGNPVVSGIIIESEWANTTMEDIEEALTNSLDRSGMGGMLAPMKFADGTESLPGITWTNEPSTGLYREALNDMRLSVDGTKLFRWYNEAAFVWDPVNSVWQKVIASNSVVVNPDGSISFEENVTFEGDIIVEGTVNFQGAQGLRPGVVNSAATTYDITATDENKLLLFSAATSVTVNVPLEATTPLPIGFITHVHQGGLGEVTFVAEFGVSINSASSLETRTQYSALSIFKVATNAWVVVGDQF
jgi:hypothetical protein